MNRNVAQLPATTSQSNYDLFSHPRLMSNNPTISFQNDGRPIVPISNSYKSPYSTNIPQFHMPQNTPHAIKSPPGSPNEIIPTYQFTKKKMAKVLVINNRIFDAPKLNRKGAEYDHQALKETLTKLKYDFTFKNNLKAADMAKQIETFAADKNLKNYNMSIVIASSHGTNNKVAGGYTEIIGTDEKGLSVETIVDLFTNEKHTHLAGQPKILIFQCCRGINNEAVYKNNVEADATPFRTHGDMLIAFSTLPGLIRYLLKIKQEFIKFLSGLLSYRTVEEGSWFIQLLCKAIDEHGATCDIESIFKIVDVKLGECHPSYKQTSLIENRGFKRCYLTPQPPDT